MKLTKRPLWQLALGIYACNLLWAVFQEVRQARDRPCCVARRDKLQSAMPHSAVMPAPHYVLALLAHRATLFSDWAPRTM